MKGNIYLVGFMGSGKSTVGRVLARSLKREFVDMDSRLEDRFGGPIHAVFDHRGEAEFRAEERRLLEELSCEQGLVVATGGGVPEDPANLELLKKSGGVVHMAADFQTCVERIERTGAETRPKWRDRGAARRLFEQRYEQYCGADLTVHVDGGDPTHTADRIVEELLGEERFDAYLGDAGSPVLATGRAAARLAEWVSDRRAFLLTDRTVGRLHLARYLERLHDATVFTVPSGERAKTLRTAQRVYESLVKERFNRDHLFVAVGGGVVTDLGAWVASTFKRGMGFILVSTTLVGCVDAAVGGKSAVNLGSTKNVIGCFTQPEGVILDLAALRTLGRPHLSEGLVEAYKTGLVAESALAEFVERHAARLLDGDPILLARLATVSAQTKAQVVGGDFRESDQRMILNFGHTFGHAVESFNRYRVSHGRSVAAGMRVACEISLMRGLVSRDDAQRIQSTLSLIAPGGVELPSATQAWQIMLQDKKIRGSRVTFILLEGRAQPTVVQDLTQAELNEALRRLGEGTSNE